MTAHIKPSVTGRLGVNTLLVSATNKGDRIDQFLVSALPETSRAAVQKLLREEKILVDGAAMKASFRLHGGEIITLLDVPGRPAEVEAAAEDIPLEVVFEDEELAVIQKPAGMVVHLGAGVTRGTLVNALLHRFRGLSGSGGTSRPGIVHRLDKGTSGLMIVAKTDFAHRKLAAQFSSREVKKRYVALVHGWMKNESGIINRGISRDRLHRTRMTTRHAGGREAISHYRLSRRIESAYGKFSLLDVKIDTGRTHQIRVHLSSLGHPVVGDVLYGAPARLLKSLQKQRPRKQVTNENLEQIYLERNFLHSAAISFVHPRTGKQFAFESDLPPELMDFLRRLEQALPV